MIKAEHYHLSGAAVNLPFSRKDVYKIWLLGRGGYLHLPDVSIALTKPALFFANPLVPYAYENDSIERSGYWCVFTQDFLPSADRTTGWADVFPFALGSEAVFLLHEPQLAAVTALFTQLIAELDSTYAYKYEAVRHYIGLLLHEGRKRQPTRATRPQPNAAARLTGLFLDALERQFPIETPQRPLTLKKASDYATQLAVHVNHLNAVVREVTGKPTSVHLAERVLHEAQALLKHTTWSIADIAYSLGFEYPNHFNNFFRKHTGTTPLAFRRR